MTLLLAIRLLLSRENKRRDNEAPTTDSYEEVYIDIVTKDGVHENVKVPKVSVHPELSLFLPTLGADVTTTGIPGFD